MKNSDIIQEAHSIFKTKDLSYLFEQGFIDVFKVRIALIRKRFFEQIKAGESTRGAILNVSIEFDLSEGTVTRYVYNYKNTNF